MPELRDVRDGSGSGNRPARHPPYKLAGGFVGWIYGKEEIRWVYLLFAFFCIDNKAL